MLLAIHGFTILLFLGLGWLFRREKGAFLISGYNTAPKAEKQKYDLKKLYRHMSRLMFLLAGCWSILALGNALGAGLAVFPGAWAVFPGEPPVPDLHEHQQPGPPLSPGRG